MSTAAQTPWIPPRPMPEILKTDPALVAEAKIGISDDEWNRVEAP